jgi:AAA domain
MSQLGNLATIVNAILRILSAKDVTLLLCAPTGRAAKRMNEATGLEAKTQVAALDIGRLEVQQAIQLAVEAAPMCCDRAVGVPDPREFLACLYLVRSGLMFFTSKHR